MIRQILTGVFESLARLRVQAFQKKIFSSYRASVPVISVGNLTFGGTGKTPVSHFLMELLQKHGRRPGLVSRSYKARHQEIRKIDPAVDRPEDVGDEAFWLAEQWPLVPVYSGPSKWKTARQLEKNEKVDVILVDDGFQHLKLQRNLDILLFDASEEALHYRAFPLGRAREALGSFQRADLCFLTKCNLAAPKNLKFHREQLLGKPIFEFDYQISALENMFSASPAPEAPQKILLLSAIARPESFKHLVRAYYPQAEIALASYPDHHIYQVSDLQGLKYKIASQKYDLILTTQKDAVKLKKISECRHLPLWVVHLALKPRFDVESLYEKIDSYLS